MGGEARLCDLLGAPPEAYARWLDGAEPIPEPAYAMLLQFLSDMEAETLLPH